MDNKIQHIVCAIDVHRSVKESAQLFNRARKVFQFSRIKDRNIFIHSIHYLHHRHIAAIQEATL